MSIKKDSDVNLASPASEFLTRMMPCPHEDQDIPSHAALLAHICVLNSVLERAGDRHTLQHGLTMAQWMALGCVGNAGSAGVTHSELGQRLMLSKAPITGVVDRLERGGFVIRVPDLHDRRVSRVQITPKGEETWETVRGSLRELAGEICEGLSEDEIAVAKSVLGRLLESAARVDAVIPVKEQ